MRWPVVTTLLLVPALVRAEGARSGFVLDVGGGIGGAVFDTNVTTPLVSLRAGYDVAVVSVGLRGIAVLGPSAREPFGFGSIKPPDANRAWLALADFELHTPGTTQFLLSFGAGLGRLIRAQPSVPEMYSLSGRTGAAWQLTAGVRSFFWSDVALGADLSGLWWKDVQMDSAGIGEGPTGSTGGHTVAGLALTANLRWRP